MVSIGDVVRAVVDEHREELQRLNSFIQGSYQLTTPSIHDNKKEQVIDLDVYRRSQLWEVPNNVNKVTAAQDSYLCYSLDFAHLASLSDHE